MSPEPSTNDYLADIAASQKRIEEQLGRLFERLGPPPQTPASPYGVFNIETHYMVSGPSTKEQAHQDCQYFNNGPKSIVYEVRRI